MAGIEAALETSPLRVNSKGNDIVQANISVSKCDDARRWEGKPARRRNCRNRRVVKPNHPVMPDSWHQLCDDTHARKPEEERFLCAYPDNEESEDIQTVPKCLLLSRRARVGCCLSGNGGEQAAKALQLDEART